MDLIVETLKVGELPTNAYIVRNEGEAFLVDPGADAQMIIKQLKGLNLKYILLTHAHFDHVLAVDEIKRAFPAASIVLPCEDRELLNALPEQGIFTGQIYKNISSEISLVTDRETLPFGEDEIRVISTPGHTIGSVCFLISDLLFSGDTLFYHTYGRLDLPYAAPEQMKSSLLKIFDLPASTKVFPGHGRSTTVGAERIFFDLK